MGRSAKKIDGRSKEARALRAKKLAKASPAPRKPRAAKTAAPREVPLDRETSLRILALQIASSNIGRDTAPRDLVPLARQIEEFLNGVTPLAITSYEPKPGAVIYASEGCGDEQAA